MKENDNEAGRDDDQPRILRESIFVSKASQKVRTRIVEVNRLRGGNSDDVQDTNMRTCSIPATPVDLSRASARNSEIRSLQLETHALELRESSDHIPPKLL
jgi:hypothetical protein